METVLHDGPVQHDAACEEEPKFLRLSSLWCGAAPRTASEVAGTSHWGNQAGEELAGLALEG